MTLQDKREQIKKLMIKTMDYETEILFDEKDYSAIHEGGEGETELEAGPEATARFVMT